MTKSEKKLINHAIAYFLHQYKIDEKFTRKPSGLEEVENTFDLNTITGPYNYDRNMITDIICSLPLIKYVNTEDGIRNNYESFQPFDNVDFCGYQYALVIGTDGLIYLIDNQGHNYCRYMVRLKNLNTEELVYILNGKELNFFSNGKYLYAFPTNIHDI